MHNTSKRNLTLMGIAVSALAAIIWKVGGGFFEDDMPPKTPMKVLAPAASSVTSAAATEVNNFDKIEIKKASVNLAAEFESERNLRVFVERVKQRPNEGGLFFANKVLRFCNIVMNDTKSEPKETSVKDTHGQLSARDFAATELASRCSGFSKADFDEMESLQDGRQIDPVLAAYKRLVLPTNDKRTLKERQTDLSIYMNNAGHVLDLNALTAVGETTKGKSIFLDGVPYGGVSEEAFLRAFSAWKLTQSRSLSQSPEQSIISMSICSFGAGRCEGDGLSRELWDLPADSPVRREVQAIYPRLSSVLSAANVEALSAPQR
jgi:hypothetical protein